MNINKAFKFFLISATLSMIMMLMPTTSGIAQTNAPEYPYPPDGYWGENSLKIDAEQIANDISNLNWSMFPIIHEATYPIANRGKEAFTNSQAMFQEHNLSLNNWVVDEGCLYTKTLSSMLHLADDMFGDPGDKIQVPLTGKPIFHHFRATKGYPGDAIIFIHKLPNGQPIFTMMGHMVNGKVANYKYTDISSYPNYRGNHENWYLDSGDPLTWVDKNNNNSGNVLIYDWGGNTHIHWELRYFPTHSGLYQQGYSTLREYPTNHCNYEVGPGYMPDNEYPDPKDNTKFLLPSDIGWYDPSKFLKDFNEGKYGRPDQKAKYDDGITLCNKVNQCSVLPEGIEVHELLLKDLDEVLIPSDYYLEFTESNGSVYCINSDQDNVRNGIYPDSGLIVSEATSTLIVKKGSCADTAKIIFTALEEGEIYLPRELRCFDWNPGNPAIRLISKDGRTFCENFGSSYPGSEAYGSTLPFNPVKVEFRTKNIHLQVYKDNGECIAFGSQDLQDDSLVSFDIPSGNYKRMEFYPNQIEESASCNLSFNGFDKPYIGYTGLEETASLIKQPKIVWGFSQLPDGKDIDYLKIQIDYQKPDGKFENPIVEELNWSASKYVPKNQGVGTYFVSVRTTITGDLNAGMNSYPLVYHIIEPPEDYVGFETSQRLSSLSSQQAFALNVPSGEVGYIWAQGVVINGEQFGLSSFQSKQSQSISSVTASSNTLLRLNEGSYQIANWSNGALEVGIDYLGEYGIYLLNKNQLEKGGTWNLIDYQEHIATPTPTITPTPSSTTTSTSTSTATPSNTSTATATATPTMTSTSTPIPTNTPTMTPSPSSTSTLQPTSTSTLVSTTVETPTVFVTQTATSIPTVQVVTATTTPIPTSTPTLVVTLTPTPSLTATVTPTLVSNLTNFIYLPLVNK